ncbi:MAG: hypothetical protein ABI550_03390 [Ignavibacteriaceae bacterium]
MIKKIFVVLSAVVLFFPLINAQNVDRSGGYARVLSMGNNPYLVDPEAIKVNPAWASEYYNFLWGDIGSNAGAAFGNGSAGQFAGFNFRLSKDFTLGGMLTRNDFNSASIGRLDPFGIVAAIPQAIRLNNNLEALASYKLGNLALGLGVAFASTKNETSPPQGAASTNATASQIGINAGVLAQFTQTILLDVGVSLILPSAKLEPDQGNTTKVSQTIIGANARLFWKYSSKLRFVPGAAFLTSSGTFDNGAASTDLTSITLFGVGVGFEYTEGDFMFVGGPGLASTSLKTPAGTNNTPPELTTSSLIFPVWNLGAEWHATDWLIGRLGYTASTGNTKTQTGTTPNAITETTITFFGPTNVTLGIGFRFGGFALDATVNADVLRQGLNNIGGGGATFAYLSTSYGF